MIRKVSDEEIYRDVCGKFSTADVAHVSRVLNAWADALDELQHKSGIRANLRITLAACINTIGTMGPAYCRIAAANLLKRAQDVENGGDNDF